MNSTEIVKLSIRANMARINELLEIQGIERQFDTDKYWCVNSDNVELRQRMKLLRKETIKLEKLIRG